MPLFATVSAKDILTINGVRLGFSRSVRVVVYDQADIVFANGKSLAAGKSLDITVTPQPETRAAE